MSAARTDPLRWRLRVAAGRQTWHYVSAEEAASTPQTACERYHLGLPTDLPHLPAARTPRDAARNGFAFYRRLQTADGHWAGEYGGPMFLVPGYVIAARVCGIAVPEHERVEIVRYLRGKVKPEGGWGIHTECPSTVFGTALNYAVLRILGVDPGDALMVRARAFVRANGGATHIPSWGKFWLAVLNVYSWDGLNPVPPELWLLPDWVPLHPGRMWCHTRAVYLPMSYIYGRRLAGPEDALTAALRDELYNEPYDAIDWVRARNSVAQVDLYSPHSMILDFLNVFLGHYETYKSQYFRDKALARALDMIRKEDANTDYLCIAPVNKMMHVVVSFFADGKDSPAFKKHMERLISQDGFFVNGTNGSQMWDTAFALQAVYDAGLAEEEEFRENLVLGLEFLDAAQIQKNPADYEACYRQMSKGAWPFSTRDQGYTVSDCTAEGLKTVLLYQNELGYTKEIIPKQRLFDAVDVLLSMRNADGGFATYETVRSGTWLEALNPAEVFGNIMVEYTYPECTTAVVLGLATFKKYHPRYRAREINATIAAAVEYVKRTQRGDGSWYGSWGVCFTYATWFGVESLAAVGEYYHNSEHVRRACGFLIGKQMADGGWGESYLSCETHEYVHHEKSQVVNTAWALLALSAAQYPHREVLESGVKIIMKRQQPNGEWLQEGIEGVFNKNCMISYPSYKFAFSIWALGRFAKVYGNDEIVY